MIDNLDRHVGLTRVTDGAELFRISTVRLSIDHSHGYGPPLWYETLVFTGEDGWTHVDGARYSTADEASAGHAAMVAKVAAKLTNPAIENA